MEDPNKTAIEELTKAARRQTAKTITAADKLEAMAATYRERNKVYGDNFVRLGHAMHAMFPQGLTINTPHDWTRLYFFFLQIVKSSRYATNFTTGGLVDSVHDAAVYNAMLEAYDETLRTNCSQVDGGDRAETPNATTGSKTHERTRFA